MKKQGTYLHERIYAKQNTDGQIRKETKEYWKAILGRDILQMIYSEKGQAFQYLCDKEFDVNKQESGSLERYLKESVDFSRIRDRKREHADEELFFPEFYMPFCDYAVLRLKEMLCGNIKFLSDKVWRRFEDQAALHLQAICIRTLIVEMHKYKADGRLKYGTPEQEYKYFCRICIRDRAFFQAIIDNYTILLRCIAGRIESFAGFYAEVVSNFKKDLPQIRGMIDSEEIIDEISDIQSTASDLHNNGKQVLKLILNQGTAVLYKPHSMENEKRYRELLEWVSEKTGIRQYNYSFLSMSEHSWCTVVSYDSCQTEAELGRYYQRLGSQLFLLYLLGTKDLHSENVIAHGEYPVLIDLETLVNIQYNQQRKTSFQEICYQLTNSVLCTGLLPFYYFNKCGGGVNSSGISGGEGQKYPFKIPAILHPKTSNMKISYRYPTSKKAQNLAILGDEFVSPSRFEKELAGGFRDAYLAVVKNRKTFKKKLENCLIQCSSRFLLLDTQRYSMLLSTSYHPGFLVDGAKREIFLHSLWKGRVHEKREVINCEIKSMLQGDIPYFYYYLDNEDLMLPEGERVKNFFDKAPLDIVFDKLDSLCDKDMVRQCEYITMSLKLMPDCAEEFENRCYKPGKLVPQNGNKITAEGLRERRAYLNKRMEIEAERLASRMLHDAIWNKEGTEVGWFTVQLSAFGKPTWEAKPMNMYLYNGLAGMLLIIYELKKRKPGADVFYDTLRCMLFKYTDFMIGETGRKVIRDTGMYDGEGSVLYTYYLMYQSGAGDEYLAYAKKHAAVVERLLEYDKRYDMMMGNAGAALALVYLYEITGDSAYLQSAERGMEVLEQNAVKMEHGIGWKIEQGFPPFAGMAHGGSGIMMPAAALWMHTGKEKYRLIMQQILEYDESLYDESIQNWTDIRGNLPGDEYGAVAWCHGAAGILLSRVFCHERVKEIEMKRQLEKDIIRAYHKLADYWKRDSWGLCHGSCGNVWILEQTKKVVEEFVGDVEVPEVLDSGEVLFLPQEKLNPGLMNGYGGVLLYFLNKLSNRT